MQAVTFPLLVPHASFSDLNEDFEKLQYEMDFQQKSIEDLEIQPNKESRKQKKFNFNPLIWTSDDQNKLIELHKKIGNKWTTLSKYFEGSCENSIKNHFYSRLRKSIRKLNKNISTLFGKKYSKFNLNIIFKLSNVSEGKVIGKCHVQNQITTFYKEFIYKLIDFSELEQENIQIEKTELMEDVENFTLALIALQNLFRIISGERVYKGKKKNIAYLKRFNFKLDTESKKTLVISKQNCYIAQGPIDIQSQTEKSSQSICSIHEVEKQLDIDTESNKNMVEDSDFEKTEERTIPFELSQKKHSNDTISYTTESQLPQSPYQSFLFDEELRQYEMTFIPEKGRYCENLLDQYSGTKFHFDIEQ